MFGKHANCMSIGFLRILLPQGRKPLSCQESMFSKLANRMSMEFLRIPFPQAINQLSCQESTVDNWANYMSREFLRIPFPWKWKQLNHWTSLFGKQANCMFHQHSLQRDRMPSIISKWQIAQWQIFCEHFCFNGECDSTVKSLCTANKQITCRWNSCEHLSLLVEKNSSAVESICLANI